MDNERNLKDSTNKILTRIQIKNIRIISKSRILQLIPKRQTKNKQEIWCLRIGFNDLRFK